MISTRRTFLRTATTGLGALIAGGGRLARAAAPPLLNGVTAACRRLAPLGWRQLLQDATGGQLDINAADLKGELTKALSRIDRSVAGFGDFNAAGTRAIEAGSPDRSLLYHAFASPAVVAGRNGNPLGGFPTLAEIEAVQNFVYGVNPPTLDHLRDRAARRRMGLVVFAIQYEDTPNSVHGHHAELCFARAGSARLGTLDPLYDARSRSFVGLDPARPFDFRVVPRQFAAYLAVQMTGAETEREGFGPQDPLDGDGKLKFWVPIHKLFNGTECISGLDLDVVLDRGLRNDELAMFHKWLDLQGLKNNWSGDDLEQYPFVIKDDRIGSFSQSAEFGTGLLVPRPQPLIAEARYKGKLLTFPVDGRYTGDPVNIQLSSLQVLPGAPTAGAIPKYGVEDASQESQRPAPEYINIRHRVLADGRIENLNKLPDMKQIIEKGGYDTLHYIDGAGDGWVAAHCPQLDGVVDTHVPAYCMVALPDFFPKVTQRDLMLWWKNEVPKEIRDALWAIPPLALSQTRIAANITLPIGFSIEDVTVPAMVTQPATTGAPVRQTSRTASAVQKPNGPVRAEKTGMPDGSPGLFDPGWDTSQGIYYSAPSPVPLQKFLAGYGLGSPFIEDAKLCAALGAYWPGVAPDSTRTFQPDKQISGNLYPYPTIAPLTDEEIGSAPLRDGKFMPWDGVRGPNREPRIIDGQRYAVYTDAWRTDYIDLVGTMTAALTSQIDLAEFKQRVMAMEAVYWGLGIHDDDFSPNKKLTAAERVLTAKAKWAVLSFRIAAANDPELAEAQRVAGARISGPKLYRFHVYRWEGKEFTDPNDLRLVLVKMREEATAYVGGTDVLLKRGNEPWTIDTSMPT